MSVSAGKQGGMATGAWVWTDRKLAWSAPSKRRSGFAVRCMVVGSMALIFVLSAASLAIADVDTAGNLRQIPSTHRSPLGEVEPLFEKASGDYECYSYSDVQNAADSFVIGNCDAPWQIQVVSYSGPNGEGFHSYGGFITGAFSGCGWIETRFEPQKLNSNKNSVCGEGSTGDFVVSESSFMYMDHHNSAAGDGWPVVTTKACPEYANYRPWSSNNIEQELIRTAPAYASSGPKSDYPALKWRYITKYESTDGTGRYVMVRDDRYNAGEGNWVFVPRSCLPSTLPENENERLPPPPTVTTDGASGVATPNATLNATINPNGVDTKDFFEYGTTKNYGFYTNAEDAGAGTNSVPVSAEISGLAAGTTYYFRIVASSAIEEVFGGPVAFTTQPPPTVSTTAASNLQPFQATLEGNVNPNGLDTHYYFQYGTTISYGSEVPAPPGIDAGSGTGSVSATTTLTGLQPGTTYHYRLVASNGGGTSYSNDQEFTTLPVPRAAAIVESNGNQAVYFRGTNGQINELYYNGTWTAYGLGGSPAVGAVPAVATQSNGDQEVYFRSTYGDIEELVYNGTWYAYGIGGSPRAVGGDPTVATQSNGNEEVYFRSTYGDIEELAYNGTWHTYGIGGSPTGDPIVASPSEGNIIFFPSTYGDIEELYYNGTWTAYGLGGSPAVGAVPAVATQSNGDQEVYFRSTYGDIEELVYNGTWHAYGIGGSPRAVGGDPTVATQSNGNEEVYFRSTYGDIEELAYNGTWHTYGIGGSPTGDPIVASPSEGNTIFFPSTNGDMEELFYNGTWTAYGLGGSPG